MRYNSLREYRGPKPHASRAGHILLLFLLILAVPLVIRYTIPAEDYFEISNVILSYMYSYKTVMIVVFIVLGIIFTLAGIKYELIDVEISKVADPNFGHHLSVTGMMSYFSMGITSNKCYIFHRYDLDSFYRKRKFTFQLQALFKFLLPFTALVLALTATCYGMLPDNLEDFSKFLDPNFLFQVEFFSEDHFKYILSLAPVLFFGGNLDILFYFIIKLLPFSETYKEDVTYKTTYYDDYGNRRTTYDTSTETVSTKPIMILISAVLYLIYSVLFFIPISNCMCRLKETKRVVRFFKKYDDAETIEDYYQRSIDDYYARHR